MLSSVFFNLIQTDPNYSYLQKSEIYKILLESYDQDEELKLNELVPINTTDIIALSNCVSFYELRAENFPDQLIEITINNYRKMINCCDLKFNEFLNTLDNHGEICQNSILYDYDNFFYYAFNNYSINSYKCVKLVCETGNINIFNFCLEEEIATKSSSKHYYSYAAIKGKLDFIKHLRNLDFEWNCWTICKSAAKGYYDIVKYAVENKCPMTEDCLIEAFRSSSINKNKIIKYLVENRCPLPNDIVAWAIEYTDLSIVRYLVEEKHFPIIDTRFARNPEILEYLNL